MSQLSSVYVKTVFRSNVASHQPYISTTSSSSPQENTIQSAFFFNGQSQRQKRFTVKRVSHIVLRCLWLLLRFFNHCCTELQQWQQSTTNAVISLDLQAMVRRPTLVTSAKACASVVQSVLLSNRVTCFIALAAASHPCEWDALREYAHKIHVLDHELAAPLL